MKRKIIISSQYKKDIKLARRRNLPEEELNEVVLSLANVFLYQPKIKTIH